MKKLLLSFLMFAALLVACSEPEEVKDPDDPNIEEPTPDDPNEPDEPAIPGVGDIVETSPTKIVAEMGIGWNLGNTLDAPTETAWGKTYATQELFDAVKERGFMTVRIPITWQDYMGDASSYTVDYTRMSRVEEVVQFAMNNGLYVIINVHHDDDWCVPSYAKINESKAQLVALWKQIAERFKKYDEHLIFETLNEPREVGTAEEWSGGTAEGRDCVNQLNAAALQTIRSTGGNNAKRQVMIPSYGAAVSSAIDGLVLPSDDKIIVSVHSYYPFSFCLQPENEAAGYWGTDADKASLSGEFDRLYNNFVAKGIPLIIGEWGVNEQRSEESSVPYSKYYVCEAVRRNICTIVWDCDYLNRRSYEWKRPNDIDAMFEGLEEGSKLDPPTGGGDPDPDPDPTGEVSKLIIDFDTPQSQIVEDYGYGGGYWYAGMGWTVLTTENSDDPAPTTNDMYGETYYDAEKSGEGWGSFMCSIGDSDCFGLPADTTGVKLCFDIKTEGTPNYTIILLQSVGGKDVSFFSHMESKSFDEWTSIEIPLSDFGYEWNCDPATQLVEGQAMDPSVLNTFKFNWNQGEGTIKFDNVYLKYAE